VGNAAFKTDYSTGKIEWLWLLFRANKKYWRLAGVGNITECFTEMSFILYFWKKRGCCAFENAQKSFA